MTEPERRGRIEELDAVEDWLMDHDPRDFLDYTYKRKNELDAMAPGPEDQH